jgi:DNA-binding beta-propeller fold protein YncE
MSSIHRVAVALLLLLAFLSDPPRTRAAVCAPTRAVLGRGLGSPDDLAVNGRTIYFTDEHAGALATLFGGRVRIVARGFRDPEGIVLQRGGHALVVEQGANRIDRVNLSTGRWTVWTSFPNTTGQLGIDGIAPAPNGGIYVPDSPYGRLWLLDKKRRLYLVVNGLGRPVGALQYAGGVAVADETANAVWLVRSGRAVRLATVSIPDDLVLVHGRLFAVTLGDGALWEIRPSVRRIVSGLGQPQGLAPWGAGSVLVADSTSNTIVRISGLGACS